MYVCMYIWPYHLQQQSMDQTGMVANPARGQLNRKNELFPVPVHFRARDEVGLARQVRSSRPTSARSFSTLRLNLVLTREISLAFRDGAQLYH